MLRDILYNVLYYASWPISIGISLYFAIAAAERCFMALLVATK